jgi:hypothetical protein
VGRPLVLALCLRLRLRESAIQGELHPIIRASQYRLSSSDLGSDALGNITTYRDTSQHAPAYQISHLIEARSTTCM